MCPYMGERARLLSKVSFIKAFIPFMRAPFSGPKHFPESLSPKAITLEVRISTFEREKDTNIQSTAFMFVFLPLASTESTTYSVCQINVLKMVSV